MNFAVVYTILILVLAIPTFFTDFAQSIPLGMRIFVLVFALAVLWLYILFFRGRGRLGFGGVILLILFYFFTFVIIVPTGVGSTVISLLESSKMNPPITIGNEENTGQIYIVYHPGASNFTTNTLKILAENIAQDDYQVTLYSVSKDLQVDFKEAAAIGFASPIYAGSVRKILADYIGKNNLSDKKCFIVVTGSDREGLEKDTSKVAELVENSGGKVIEKTKFFTSDKENELKNKINLFSRELLDKL